jgi:hypothetical protein
MAIPNATKQAASNAVAALGNWVAVFTSTGAGTTGANEASGGDYSRKQISWSPGNNGTNVSTVASVPVPQGTYTEAGLFSASTTGTFVGSDAFADGSVEVSGLGAFIDVTASIVVP